jgi:hypothetical protein
MGGIKCSPEYTYTHWRLYFPLFDIFPDQHPAYL